MKYFKNYQMFTEAIDIKDVRKYLKVEREKNLLELLDSMFKRLQKLPGAEISKRGERVYIPFEGKMDTEIQKSPIQQEIESFFSTQNIEIVDYKKGLAKEGRRQMKIGKFLVKLKRPDLLKKFNNDPQREGATFENGYIVFSKHPYDIAGQSTNRGWTSCMDIYKGSNKEYVQIDITEGTFVAYLVRSDDRNINNPIARISIKPYVNEDNDRDKIYFSEKSIYGTANPEFKKQIDKILGTIQKIKNLASYQLSKGLYCDSASRILNINTTIDDLNKEEIRYILDHYKIRDYSINEDMTVDVNGDVDLSRSGLNYIPVRFNFVSGDFNCYGNNLTSLEGCPTEVRGIFDCSDNNLTSLEGCPRSVESIDCGDNELTSLIGGPVEVNNYYVCENNKLTSLKGSPYMVEGYFNCSKNKLTSLKGGPTTAESYNCNNNQLTSLDGAPQKIYSTFECEYNHLITLQGAPQQLGYGFKCRDNRLTSLEGGPKTAVKMYFCGRNRLTTLKGSPREIIFEFDCSENQLTNLIGGPEKVGRVYDCSKNLLTSLEGSPREIGYRFDCSNNQLTTFEGGPRKVGSNVYCENNKVKISKEDIEAICDVGNKIYI